MAVVPPLLALAVQFCNTYPPVNPGVPGGRITFSENSAEPVAPNESVTVIVKENPQPAVGVPKIVADDVPEGERVSPPGSAPPVTWKENGPVPLITGIDWLYAVFSVASGSAPPANDGPPSDVFTRILNGPLAVAPNVSCTWTVKV